MARSMKPEDVTRLRRETAMAFYRQVLRQRRRLHVLLRRRLQGGGRGAARRAIPRRPALEREEDRRPSWTAAWPSRRRRSGRGWRRAWSRRARPRSPSSRTPASRRWRCTTRGPRPACCAAACATSCARSCRGTYGASVGYSDQAPLPGYGTEAISFGSAPDSVEKLEKAALAEVARLQKEGPSAEDVQKIQEIERRELETSLKQNPYWLGSLQTVHMLGWDPLSIARRQQRIATAHPRQPARGLRPVFPAGPLHRGQPVPGRRPPAAPRPGRAPPAPPRPPPRAC